MKSTRVVLALLVIFQLQCAEPVHSYSQQLATYCDTVVADLRTEQRQEPCEADRNKVESFITSLLSI